MTDSIVLQLQMLASDPSSDVEGLLNKALLVASKLKIKKFKKWCEIELDGYSDDRLPTYRCFKGQLKVWNPYHGFQSFLIPHDLDELVTSVKMHEPIGQIKNLLSQKGDNYGRSLPNSAKKILMNMQGSYGPLEPTVLVVRTQLLAILTQVRNEILKWSIELEEKGILGRGLKFTDKEKESAMSINNYNIGNFQGIAGNVIDSTVNQNNQMNVYAKDFDSLARVLADNKVAFSDIQELKSAIEVDDQPTEPNRLGINVSEWIGKMIGKAATGSWEISVATAGTLLAEAIGKFYGF